MAYTWNTTLSTLTHCLSPLDLKERDSCFSMALRKADKNEDIFTTSNPGFESLAEIKSTRGNSESGIILSSDYFELGFCGEMGIVLVNLKGQTGHRVPTPNSGRHRYLQADQIVKFPILFSLHL
jgi:hypothetical protein